MTAHIAEPDFEVERVDPLESTDRQRQAVIERIAKVLEKIVQVLPDTPGTTDSQKPFVCKEPPSLRFAEFLQRFVTFGQVPIQLMLAGLMFTDRALRTRRFSQKSVVHK